MVEDKFDREDTELMKKARAIMRTKAGWPSMRVVDNKLWALQHYGARRTPAATKARTRGGRFTRGEAPEPSTRQILQPEAAHKLCAYILRYHANLELTCPVSSGLGPHSKSFEVCVDGNVERTKRYAFEKFRPLFESCRDLLREARMRTQTLGLEVPLLPKRVFVCVYPAGVESGMATHVDSHVTCGAVTVALTDDEEGGCFYTVTGYEYEGEVFTPLPRRDVPLLAGQAVAVVPYQHHGVHKMIRSGNR